MQSNMSSKLAAKLQTAKNLLKSSVNSLGPDREFENLIRSIGECKSKQEEDRIIFAEIDTLKQRLSDPKLDKTRGREYMVRAIYCEMLGHDVGFAHVKALQFASEPNILTKKAAYLALTQFLDHNNELVLLLVNTLLSELKSDNYIAVCTGLVVATKLIGPELINAVLPTVMERLHHPKEHVRKKAVMVLHRFHQLDPRREGSLAGVDIDRSFRTMLCDKDPAVMSAALSALHEVIKTDPKPYKNLVPSFTSILKQVAEHRLPKSYDYHRFPAPFIQIKLLKVLAALGVGDRVASENMYAVIQQTLKRANNTHMIGSAIVYECVRTITTIYPNPQLLAMAAESVSAFLKSPSHNLRYVGIDALAGIVKINSQYAQEHQLAVIDCLEDPDDTLKLKTLELLYKMTKANNVEVIVERMMSYLRTTTDEHIKKDIVRRVSELAERYAPSPTWFIAVVSEVFQLGGPHVESQLAHNLMHLIAEQDEDLHRSAVEAYLSLLDKPKLPERLLEVACWVLGEYGSLAATSSQNNTQAQAVMNKLAGVVKTQKATEGVKGYILVALSKISAQSGCSLTPEAEELVVKASSSQNVELQQRSYELQSLLTSAATSAASLQQAVLPLDGSCEDIDDTEMIRISTLSFLDGYVNDALKAGAAPYLSEEQRTFGGSKSLRDLNGDKGSLKFEAYETATAPSTTSTTFKQNRPGSSSTSSSHYEPHQPVQTSASSSSQHNGAGAPRASGPELQLRGTGKWGPAQFESSSPAAAKASAAAPTHSTDPRHADLLGSPLAARSQPTHVSERDRLAASIFGGSSSTSSASAASIAAAGQRPPVKAAAAAPAARQLAQAPPQRDLLDFDSPMKATESPAPAPAVPPSSSQLDLLLDLDVLPPSAPSSTHSFQPYNAYPTQHLPPPLAGAAAALGGMLPVDLLGGSILASGVSGGTGGGTGGVLPTVLGPASSTLQSAGTGFQQTGAATHAAPFNLNQGLASASGGFAGGMMQTPVHQGIGASQPIADFQYQYQHGMMAGSGLGTTMPLSSGGYPGQIMGVGSNMPPAAVTGMNKSNMTGAPMTTKPGGKPASNDPFGDLI
ncbi:hypothetical protein CEUSTIGMA_g11384.t1 [Chlamydomonas eustigma]|uniref:Clathrin/coatomer adaptor adaptin-like N-terminal domain-containing protein n=1 Tax=Chlamydomonas eustigma TaxID=1157962 RepID=A0A250XME7_9CHLO|nr:hypothetical protein CEUSTIGMA_g11384.t1 [Chlamydomonas eustigma]|eukprot:GAX83960.1 hypothetical protein CEUSTIGMA_g11384.t1 [Chlamydomonas eustigma]